MYNFTCTPRAITSYLLSGIGILLTANFFVIHRMIIAPDPVLKGFRAAFYFGSDANFPSLYTALFILASAALLWKAGNNLKDVRYADRFKMLSIFFGLLAMDDFMNIHQQIVLNLTELLQVSFHAKRTMINYLLASSFFTLILVILITGYRFLPATLNSNFLFGVLLYFMGSGAKFLINGQEPAQPGMTDVFTSLGHTCGQLLKMSGLLLFLQALVTYYLHHIKRAEITLSFSPNKKTRGAAEVYEELSLK